MKRSAGLARRLALLLVALASACSSEEVPPPLQLSVAPSTGSCEVAREAETLSALSGGTLRLTLQQRLSGSGTTLLCDRLIDIKKGGSASSDLAFDAKEKGNLDLLAEVFSGDNPPQLLASGLLSDVNARPRLGPAEILLARVDRFSCAQPSGAARAFHSATRLPDGRVLIVGGVTHVAPTGAAGPGLYIEPSIELYEPRNGRFSQVTGTLPTGRALHAALSLGGPPQGPFDVLLVGGLRAVEGQTPVAPALIRGTAQDALPFVPGPGAEAAATVILRVYPFTEPPQVQVQPAPPGLAARILGSTARLDDGTLLVSGGLRELAGGRLSTEDTVEQLPAGTTEHRGPFGLQRARVGAASAALTANQALLVGGNLDSTPGQLAAEAMELLEVGATVKSRLASFEVGSQARVRAVAHATLSNMGEGEALLVGGLLLTQGQALTLRSDFPVQRVTAVAGELRVTNVASALFVPVAYHAATALAADELLLSGGLAAPQTCPGGESCNKAYRYRTQGDELVELDPLRQGRLGHAATQLLGRQVLLTGGLSVAADGSSTALAGAELYHQSLADDPFGRAAGQGSSVKFCAK